MNRSSLAARLAGLAAGVTVLAACGGSSSPSPQPPSAPTGLVATAGDGAVELKWTAVAGATSYYLYRATSTGALSTKTKVVTPVTTNAYVDGPVANDLPYYYQVTAANSAGESAGSNEASATPSASALPFAPTGVSAIGGTDEVTVTWSDVTGAASYDLYWSTSSPVTTGSSKITGVTSPYVHGSRTPGTTYYYAVVAVNANGESPLSAEVSATPPTTLPPPFISAASIRWTQPMPGGVPIQAVRICTDSSCSTPVSTATVTMNSTTLTWDGTRHEYTGNVMPAVGYHVTLTVTIPAGGAVAAGTYTATANTYNSAPTMTMPTGSTVWSRAVAHDLTWTAGAPTSTTPASVYVVGLADGTGTFYPIKSNDGPTEVDIGSLSFTLPAGTLPAAGTYVAFIGIGTTGIVDDAAGGVAIPGATADSGLHVGFVSAAVPFTVTN